MVCLVRSTGKMGFDRTDWACLVRSGTAFLPALAVIPGLPGDPLWRKQSLALKVQPQND